MNDIQLVAAIVLAVFTFFAGVAYGRGVSGE